VREIELHPEAVSEARAAREWYAERSPVVAQAFVDELERALERVGDRPEAWPPYLHGTRRYLLHRFPFLLVYRVSTGGLQVVAVAHAKRRPGYWAGR